MIPPSQLLPFRRVSLLFLLVSVLAAAFFSVRFIQLEIVPFYPLYMDQNGYLSGAYAYSDLARQDGYLSALEAHLGHDARRLGFMPSLNSQMSLVASWIFPFLGEGRLSALSIHIASWMLLLSSLYFVIRQITRCSGYALAALGISLFLHMPHVGAGGMSDFRMDFPAACWMGISLALWTLFLHRPKLSYAWLAAGATAVLLFFRIIAFVYLGLPMGVMMLLVAHSFWSGTRRGLRRSVIPLLILGLCAAAMIVWDWSFIKSYYFDSQLGSDVAARGADKTWNNFSAAISYYPLSLAESHFGTKLLWILLLGAAGSAGLFASEKWKGKLSSRLPIRRTAILFCFCAALFPIAILTANPHRTPQVAGISVIALVLTIFLAFLAFRPRRERFLVKILGLTVACAGLFWWPLALAQSAPFKREAKKDAVSLNWVFASVFEELTRNPLKEPNFAVYDFSEALVGYGIWFYGREQLHSKHKAACVFPLQIQSMESGDMLRRLKTARVVIFPRNPEILKTRPYPISRSMFEHYPAVKTELMPHMTLRSSFTYQGVLYDIFVLQ